MIPPDQDSLESSLLCILYEKANGRNHFTSIDQVANRFRPPIAEDRVQIGFATLANRGLAEADIADRGNYKINRKGIEWIESEFAIGFDGENHQFRRRRNGGSLPANDTQAKIDWTKWGTIAAWIGLPFTVLAILVAIWLDHN